MFEMAATEYRRAVKEARVIFGLITVAHGRTMQVQLSKAEALDMVKGCAGEFLVRARWLNDDRTHLRVGSLG